MGSESGAGHPTMGPTSGRGGSSGSLSVANLSALAALNTTGLRDFQRVWVETLRDEWYIDKSSTATVTTGIIIAGTPTGRWFRCVIPDALFQTQTEWWYDAPGGTLEATGLSDTAAINSIVELARRIGNSGGILTSVTLYTRLNLSAAEQAAFDILVADSGGRPWRQVSGELPMSPRLWYSAQDPAGTGVKPANGSLLSTWANLGSDAAAGNATAAGAARPTFVLVGDVGSLRNKSVVRYSTAAMEMLSGNVAPFALPNLRLLIVRSNAAGTKFLVDGNDGAARGAIADSGSSLLLYAGTSSGGIPGIPTMTKGVYHAVITCFDDNDSLAQMDGVVGTAPVDTGVQLLDGVSLGALISTAPITDGDIVEYMVFPTGSSDVTMFNEWLEYHYGIFPQTP